MTFLLEMPPQMWVALIGLAVALFGIHLFAGAWERVGDTPYCKKCRTDLSGVYDRCPKCNQSSQSYGVLRGDKKLQPARFLVGLALAAVGVGAVLYVFLAFDPEG